jgi:hypothetical protein
VALLAVAGCGGEAKPIAYRDITRELHGFQPPRLVREAFTTQSAFAKYVRHESPGITNLPQIDWAHREAILVAAGPRSSTGYALRVVSVRKRDGRLVVTVHERTPSLGEPVIARVTYPYRLITVPKTSLQLLLHYEGRP